MRKKVTKKELIELISQAIGKQTELKNQFEYNTNPQVKELYDRTRGSLEALHAIQLVLRYNDKIDIVNYLIN